MNEILDRFRCIIKKERQTIGNPFEMQISTLHKIFRICAMILLYYKHADAHIHTTTVAACFRCVFCMRRGRGLWGTRDSECFNLCRLKDSGTKILAFQGRYEWCILKHQRADDLPKSGKLTVDNHCQSTCKDSVPMSIFISSGAERLTARHMFCASKRFFSCQICTSIFVKPQVFGVSRTDLHTATMCHLGKVRVEKGAVAFFRNVC